MVVAPVAASKASDFGGFEFSNAKADDFSLDDIFGTAPSKSSSKKKKEELSLDIGDLSSLVDTKEEKDTSRDPFLKAIGPLLSNPKDISYNQTNTMCSFMMEHFTHM